MSGDPLDAHAFAYYRKACLSYHVAIDQLDDCVQDVSIASWQYGELRAIVVKRTIIDFLRREGPYTEHNRQTRKQRDAYRSVDEIAHHMDSFEEDARPNTAEYRARESLTVFDEEMPDYLESRRIEDVLKSAPLTVRERAIVQLYCVDGWPLLRIGGAFGLSEARVGQLVRRALKRLRAALECGKIAPTQT